MRWGMIGLMLTGIFTLSGCGNGNNVSGTVSFSDGTPLTCGRVVLASEELSLFGSIDSKGQYLIARSEQGSGVPKGTYQVYIEGAVQSGKTDSKPVELDRNGNQIRPVNNDQPDIPLIAEKFTRKATSGLECQVRSQTVFDIQVEKP